MYGGHAAGAHAKPEAEKKVDPSLIPTPKVEMTRKERKLVGAVLIAATGGSGPHEGDDDGVDVASSVRVIRSALQKVCGVRLRVVFGHAFHPQVDPSAKDAFRSLAMISSLRSLPRGPLR
jgi:hypothetical protein